jgi:hypothetical protein
MPNKAANLIKVDFFIRFSEVRTFYLVSGPSRKKAANTLEKGAFMTFLCAMGSTDQICLRIGLDLLSVVGDPLRSLAHPHGRGKSISMPKAQDAASQQSIIAFIFKGHYFRFSAQFNPNPLVP